MSFSTFLQQGGPIMYVLLGMSVVALAILLLKLVQFARHGLWDIGFLESSLAALQAGDRDRALAICHQSKNPASVVLAAAITFGDDPKMDEANTNTEVSRVGSQEVRKLQSWLRALSAIAHLSPLLGLLGTVMGMIEAFMDLESAGANVDPSLLSGGIWEALLTTAFGLAVAIPSMGAYFLLEGWVDRVRGIMKDAATRTLVYYRREKPWEVTDGV